MDTDIHLTNNLSLQESLFTFVRQTKILIKGKETMDIIDNIDDSIPYLWGTTAIRSFYIQVVPILIAIKMCV